MGTIRRPFDEALPLPTISVAPPTIVVAPNASWTITTNSALLIVPAGQTWEVKAFFGRLTTSATTGNRLPSVNILDASGNIVFESVSNAAMGASAVGSVSGGPDVPYNSIGASVPHIGMPIPGGLYLPAGFKFKLLDNYNLDAVGDLWSQLSLFYNQW
jgi:hypothetical protein